MSAVTETFDGISNGVTITASNTNFDYVGGSPVADTSLKAHGAASADCNITAATAGLTHQYTATLTQHYARVYVYMDSLPSATTKILTARNEADTGQCWDIRVTSAGAVQLRGGGGSTQVDISADGLVSTGSWWRLEAGFTSGNIEVRIYTDPESSTAADTLTGTFTQTISSRMIVGTLTSATWDFHVDTYESSDSTWVGAENPGAESYTRTAAWSGSGEFTVVSIERETAVTAAMTGSGTFTCSSSSPTGTSPGFVGWGVPI